LGHEESVVAPLAGLLVEYFIVGGVASLWLAPLVISALLSHPALAKAIAPVAAATLVPAIYVVGMVWRPPSQQVHAYATAYEPKVAAEMDLRSTRDRVARGSIIASLPLIALSPPGYKVWWHGMLSGVVAIVCIALLWARIQKLSGKYEIQVIRVLSEHKVLNELLKRLTLGHLELSAQA
jgi:hypothetical protein